MWESSNFIIWSGIFLDIYFRKSLLGTLLLDSPSKKHWSSVISQNCQKKRLYISHLNLSFVCSSFTFATQKANAYSPCTPCLVLRLQTTNDSIYRKNENNTLMKMEKEMHFQSKFWLYVKSLLDYLFLLLAWYFTFFGVDEILILHDYLTFLNDS